jgi:hypothetical protein
MDRDTMLHQARRKLMSQRRVVCTGNPDKEGTLASGFRRIFPDAVFLCRTTGWDLTDHSEKQRQRLTQVFSGCNTFLNCSYIEPHNQIWLLDVCDQSVKFCDVVNIGSTHEYDGLGSLEYQDSKNKLRERSLALNTFRFRTCHFILGGIKKDHSDLQKNWLDVDLICKTIIDVWNHPYCIPITCMDQFKKPW